MKDFFISYTSADHKWAEWIAWTLEDAGYTVKFQHWDIRPGMDFAKEMEDAITQCNQTIAVLSQQYFNSTYASAEWRATWANDVNGKERKLIPVRVEECDLKGFHKIRVYIDLVNKDRDDIQTEYKRLKELGVLFRSEPQQMGPIMAVLFEDTCGNLIQLYQIE